MIANQTPSLIRSTAAAVAAHACTILPIGIPIEFERSTMMISALPPAALPPAAAGPGGGAPLTSAVRVTIALTSRPPVGRYGLWSMSTVNPSRPVMAGQSAYFAAGGDGTGVPTQRA